MGWRQILGSVLVAAGVLALAFGGSGATPGEPIAPGLPEIPSWVGILAIVGGAAALLLPGPERDEEGRLEP